MAICIISREQVCRKGDYDFPDLGCKLAGTVPLDHLASTIWVMINAEFVPVIMRLPPLHT